jgi:hypothetical protein
MRVGTDTTWACVAAGHLRTVAVKTRATLSGHPWCTSARNT